MSEVAVVGISSDEWYPCYSVNRSQEWGVKREVPDETLERWERVMKEFDQVQSEMDDVMMKGSDPE